MCRGPIDLPEEAQFSNSHFSDADCRSLEKTANRRRLWDFVPRPFPMPWFGVKQPRPELL